MKTQSHQINYDDIICTVFKQEIAGFLWQWFI